MSTSALEELDQRLARGDIETAEYARLKALILTAAQSSSPQERPLASQNSSRADPEKNSGIGFGGVFGICLIALLGVIAFAISAAPKATDLKVVSLTADGFLLPKVKAQLYNEGSGAYFSFTALSNEKEVLCEGGRTYIAQNERRNIEFNCPKMIDYGGDTFELRWKRG